MTTFKNVISSIITIVIVCVGSYTVMYKLTTLSFHFTEKVIEAMKKYIHFMKKFFTKNFNGGEENA